MTIKNEVLIRTYIVFCFLIVAAVIIMVQAVRLSVGSESETWRERGRSDYIKMRSVQADRGNILAHDGSLLATSLPFFDIAFDPNSSGMSDADWNNSIDSLAYLLAEEVVDGYTPGAYRDYLIRQRNAGVEYINIKRNASYSEMMRMRTYPLFKLGQFKGGFIAVPRFNRERPFGMMARRTVGYVKETEEGDSTYVGIEGRFNDILRGTAGTQPMVRIGSGIYKPLNDLAMIKPTPGQDVVTTIDVDLQDITEQALYRAMEHHRAEYGTAVIMEVETGAIRAIANLGQDATGERWYEDYNYAVGTASEPGSTFKLASIMALLEDEYVSIYDTIDLERGRTEIYDEVLLDASPHNLERTSVEEAFEISSNVGIAKMIRHFYGKDRKGAERFIAHMRDFRLHLPTGVEIRGEAAPLIKNAFDEDQGWSGTTLPWMSIGYETQLTPLQMLTLYNTVANNGYMMMPRLVTEIQQYGETVEKFPFTRVRRSIASEQTIATVQHLLEGVVKRGTAKKYRSEYYDFAGKTGTAQLGYSRIEDRNTVTGYQASFAGYFPARNPQYSCIVLISKPKQNGIYGSQVALPVFREIADRTVAIKADLHPRVARVDSLTAKKLPRNDVGFRQDIQYVAASLELPIEQMTANEWTVMLPTKNNRLDLAPRRISRKLIPNVTGMGLRDAVYLLENLGLLVEFSGVGKVKRQSIKAGTANRGQTIKLTLG